MAVMAVCVAAYSDCQECNIVAWPAVGIVLSVIILSSKGLKIEIYAARVGWAAFPKISGQWYPVISTFERYIYSSVLYREIS